MAFVGEGTPRVRVGSRITTMPSDSRSGSAAVYAENTVGVDDDTKFVASGGAAWDRLCAAVSFAASSDAVAGGAEGVLAGAEADVLASASEEDALAGRGVAAKADAPAAVLAARGIAATPTAYDDEMETAYDESVRGFCRVEPIAEWLDALALAGKAGCKDVSGADERELCHDSPETVVGCADELVVFDMLTVERGGVSDANSGK